MSFETDDYGYDERPRTPTLEELMTPEELATLRARREELVALQAIVRDKPRINIELLGEMWGRMESTLIAEAAQQSTPIKNYRRTNTLDGWDQAAWRRYRGRTGDRCGSTMCTAGWVVALDAEKHGGKGGWLIPEAVLDAWYVYHYERPRGEEREQHRERGLFRRHRDDGDNNTETEHEWVKPEIGRSFYEVENLQEYLRAREDDPADDVQTADLGNDQVQVINVRRRARRVLGLTETEAEQLFDGNVTLHKLRGMIATLMFEERVRRQRWVAYEALSVAQSATEASESAGEGESATPEGSTFERGSQRADELIEDVLADDGMEMTEIEDDSRE